MYFVCFHFSHESAGCFSFDSCRLLLFRDVDGGGTIGVSEDELLR